jgi:hypothetical protein
VLVSTQQWFVTVAWRFELSCHSCFCTLVSCCASVKRTKYACAHAVCESYSDESSSWSIKYLFHIVFVDACSLVIAFIRFLNLFIASNIIQSRCSFLWCRFVHIYM